MTVRDRLVQEAEWGIAHEPQVHYAQTRPINLAGWKAHRLPWYGDCSSSIKAIYYSCGLDPDGEGNQGNTATLLAAGERVAQKEALPGDVGIFVAGDLSVHAVMLLTQGSGSDPWCYSHGQERGPIKIRLSAEKAYHGSEHLIWVAFVPGLTTWDIVAGDGTKIARAVERPGAWAAAHPKVFRKRGKVTFVQKSG